MPIFPTTRHAYTRCDRFQSTVPFAETAFQIQHKNHIGNGFHNGLQNYSWASASSRSACLRSVISAMVPTMRKGCRQCLWRQLCLGRDTIDIPGLVAYRTEFFGVRPSRCAWSTSVMHWVSLRMQNLVEESCRPGNLLGSIPEQADPLRTEVDGIGLDVPVPQPSLVASMAKWNRSSLVRSAPSARFRSVTSRTKAQWHSRPL